jgi:hypothetical protein
MISSLKTEVCCHENAFQTIIVKVARVMGNRYAVSVRRELIVTGVLVP